MKLRGRGHTPNWASEQIPCGHINLGYILVFEATHDYYREHKRFVGDGVDAVGIEELHQGGQKN
jgi:hypothetical protein